MARPYHLRIGSRASRTPTRRELECLVAVVEHGTAAAAARSLGLATQTVKWHLAALYGRLGMAVPGDRTRAAVLLWPVLGDRYRLPEPAGGWRPFGEPSGARTPVTASDRQP